MKTTKTYETLAMLIASAAWLSVPCRADVLYANAISNGGAESYTLVNPLSTDGLANFTGWTRTGNVFVDTYAVFPVIFGNPGAEQFGNAYFFGGDEASSQLTQLVSVSAVGSIIDTGYVNFQLRGWLGAARQVATGPVDSIDLTVRFLSGLGLELGRTGFSSPDQAELTLLGSPVTGQEYSVLRTANGFLPAGTRSIDISLFFTRQQGAFLNGSADNLSLALISTPEPSTWTSMAIGFAALVLAGRKKP